MTDIKNGDRVLITSCPRYRSACGAHKGRVVGEPVMTNDGYCAPVRFRCFDIQHANYPCNRLIKINEMSKTAIALSIFFGFILLTGLWFMGNYNSLVGSQTAVEKAWANVETQYQRRFDLVGNLVESVKGGQKQELAVFTAIADARKQYANAQSVNEKAAAASVIETNIALIPRMQEAYPDLKSNQLVASLMSDLRSTENQIATVRDSYNATATNYNANVRRFPKNIFANIFGFKPVVLFKAVSGADKAVEVKF